MVFKTKRVLIKDLIDNKDNDCPLPIEVIPNQMGINLCAVESVEWTEQGDGQLASLTIHFIPSKDLEPPEPNNDRARIRLKAA